MTVQRVFGLADTHMRSPVLHPREIGEALVEMRGGFSHTARPFVARGTGMLSGFNTNIRYRSVLFHVQSEDSGRDHPHIITHLYHGGTIIASEKSTYEDRVDEANLPDIVKSLMESQHKAVLKRLTAGEFDSVIRERLGDVFGDPADTKAATRPHTDATDAPASLEPAAPAPSAPADSEEVGFGDGIVSEKPLDEVILDYLVESARKRKRRS
ncbi:MAG: hypothetical protein OEP95_06375 [Myxococcales bacterium]|nr:hypothetical protein [Myxococcales bacterium]